MAHITKICTLVLQMVDGCDASLSSGSTTQKMAIVTVFTVVGLCLDSLGFNPIALSI